MGKARRRTRLRANGGKVEALGEARDESRTGLRVASRRAAGAQAGCSERLGGRFRVREGRKCQTGRYGQRCTGEVSHLKFAFSSLEQPDAGVGP
jgi:hypothetical protein